MSNIVTRAVSGFFYITLFLAATLISADTFLALTSIFGLVCLWEFEKLIGSKQVILYLALPILAYAMVHHVPKDFRLICVYPIVGFSLWLIKNLYQPNKASITSKVGQFFLTLGYIIMPFVFLISLPFIGIHYQSEIMICILVFIWVNDSFAYLVGKNFGKRKLFERISPKKTIEGFIGGWIFTLLCAFCINRWVPTPFTQLDLFIVASIISVIGTYGDLIESKFKRIANTKDSGQIMPGHGGLLDRLDSLYFAAPFVYLYLSYSL